MAVPGPSAHVVALARPERVDELRELWLALHRHHREVTTLPPVVADDDASWQRRRHDYLHWLADGAAFLLVASELEGGPPIGYAFVKLAVGLDDTWPMGERHAELYTLTVAEAARGRGVGTRLMDAVDAELANRASPISRSRSWRATDAPSGSTNGAA